MGIEARGLRKEYPGFTVLLDFQVEDGETLILAGPSGCGKTTALRLLAGLAEADAGELRIDGAEVGSMPAWRRNAAVVFQDLALFPHLSVAGNVAYGPFIHGVKRSERRRIVDACLAAVRLAGYGRRRIETLSGGERQRTAIARALAASPRLLLMDEPFSSLDAPLRRELRREFRELRSRSDIPCVFVTHDREEAASLGDRIALLDRGRIVETGSPRDLFLRPRTEFAAAFFGSGQVLPARRIGGSAMRPTLDCPLGRFAVTADTPVSAEAGPHVRLFVPKDALTLGPPPVSLNGAHIGAEGILRGYSFEGDMLHLELELRDGTGIRLETGGRRDIPPLGAELGFFIDQGLLRILETSGQRPTS